MVLNLDLLKLYASLMILISSLSHNIMAYSGGDGTSEDPYKIATAKDLIELGNDPYNYDKHFILTADIDLDPNLPDGKVFEQAVIAPEQESYNTFDSTPFSGHFNGQGYVIRHLYISPIKDFTPQTFFGLFGKLDTTAHVVSLGLEGVNILNTIASTQFIGGVAGINAGTIMSCYCNGTILGGRHVGCLVGDNRGTIVSCYSTGIVTGSRSVGGLIGQNSGGKISFCHSTCEVHEGFNNRSNEQMGIGGLIGKNEGQIESCYSNGLVKVSEANAGGLAGSNQGLIIRSNSSSTVKGKNSVGGLVGSNRASIGSSYSQGIAIGKQNNEKATGSSNNRGRASGTRYVGGLVGYSEGSLWSNFSTTTAQGDRQRWWFGR